MTEIRRLRLGMYPSFDNRDESEPRLHLRLDSAMQFRFSPVTCDGDPP